MICWCEWLARPDGRIECVHCGRPKVRRQLDLSRERRLCRRPRCRHLGPRLRVEGRRGCGGCGAAIYACAIFGECQPSTFWSPKIPPGGGPRPDPPPTCLECPAYVARHDAAAAE